MEVTSSQVKRSADAEPVRLKKTLKTEEPPRVSSERIWLDADEQVPKEHAWSYQVSPEKLIRRNDFKGEPREVFPNLFLGGKMECTVFGHTSDFAFTRDCHLISV